MSTALRFVFVAGLWRIAEATSTCEPAVSEGEAFELIDLEGAFVYLSDGKDAYTRSDINAAAYESWTPPLPYQKNVGVRYTTMASSCVYASPGEDTFTTDTKIEADEPWANGPTTWGILAWNSPNEDLGLGGCYPEACDGSYPFEGSIKFYQISKCHHMVWEANTTQNFLKDPWGNEYIMHATGCEECAKKGEPADKDKIKMPDGWIFESRVMESKLDLHPTPAESTEGKVGKNVPAGSYPCGFTLIQDAHSNAYHRVVYKTDEELIKKLKLIPEPNLWLMANASWFIPLMIILGILVLVLLAGCVYKATCGASKEGDDKAVEMKS